MNSDTTNTIKPGMDVFAADGSTLGAVNRVEGGAFALDYQGETLNIPVSWVKDYGSDHLTLSKSLEAIKATARAT